MLKQSVKDIFIRFTAQFEGHTLWPYLDVKGLLTIGYGNLIDPYVSPLLDWRDQNGSPLDDHAVREGLAKVKAMQDKKDMGGGVFRWYTGLRATEASINALCFSTLDNMYYTLLNHYLPDLDAWPADAQLALMSWAWACGGNAMPKWPKFHAACLAKDWATCGTECHISTDGNPGVRNRNIANLSLFRGVLTNTDPDIVNPSAIAGLT